MSDDRTPPPPSEAVARQLIQLTEEAIKQMMAATERAKERLASGSVPQFPDVQDPHGPEPYPWETSEPDPEDAKRVWFAAVHDFGAGEVLSVYFAAALARDEDEFRRCISSELGRELANMADVKVGVHGSSLPSRFLPPTFVDTLEALDRGGGGSPATISFLLRYHAKLLVI
jgi:hypothetical protein